MPADYPRPDGSNDAQVEQFIRTKYERAKVRRSPAGACCL